MIFDIRDADYRYNPYHTFKKLREDAPVCRIKPYGFWAVSRYADVKMILKNYEIFSSADIAVESVCKGPESLLNSRGMLGFDGPDHDRLRRLVAKAFTPVMIRNFETKIRLLCINLVEEMKKKSLIDFIEDFSMPLPIIFIAELMGMDAEKKNDFKRWANLLITWRNKILTSEILNDVSQMFHYFTSVIAKRKNEPKEDLVSSLVLACEEERALTTGEVLQTMRLLLVAGSETITHLLGNAMLALLSHPDCMEQIVKNTAKIPNFIEESLRYDGPSLSLIRKVKADIEIANVLIRKGEIVLPLLGSANHDEDIFTDAEHFDMERNTKGHLAFGTGIHHCLGLQLARLQARIAFEEFISHFKKLKRVNNEPLVYLDSFFFRGVQKLPLINLCNN